MYINSIKAAAGFTSEATTKSTVSLQRALAAYWTQRKDWAKSPAFFFDCASFFYDVSEEISAGAVDVVAGKANGATAWAAASLRILTNVLELDLAAEQVRRIVGYALRSQGHLDLAASVFDTVRLLRPSEPQSYRDLALTRAERCLSNLTKALPPTPQDSADAVAVVRLMEHVVGAYCPPRFGQIQLTCLMELNAFLAVATQRAGSNAGWTDVLAKAETCRSLPFPFRVNLACDLRVSLAWDTDMTDIDLHVMQPDKVEAYYGNRYPKSGAEVSRDFRNGYGPEEFFVVRGVSFPCPWSSS